MCFRKPVEKEKYEKSGGSNQNKKFIFLIKSRNKKAVLIKIVTDREQDEIPYTNANGRKNKERRKWC